MLQQTVLLKKATLTDCTSYFTAWSFCPGFFFFSFIHIINESYIQWHVVLKWAEVNMMCWKSRCILIVCRCFYPSESDPDCIVQLMSQWCEVQDPLSWNDFKVVWLRKTPFTLHRWWQSVFLPALNRCGSFSYDTALPDDLGTEHVEGCWCELMSYELNSS